ncbi:MAG: DUF4837 family protein [Candidatus Cloacimonadota bacterium]|nr:DUF4837 family protein [Candidatus Cloacimonadota bacterium]
MKNRILILLLMFAFLISCFDNDKKYIVHQNLESIRKPISWGHEQKIYVVCDEELWNSVNNDLRESLSRKVMTTELEPFFDIERIDFEYFEDFYKFKNLLFLGNIESKSPVSIYLQELLNENDLAEVREDKGKLFVKTNLWANDQYIMFVMGDSNKIVDKIVNSQKEKIFKLYENRFRKRLEFQAYKTQVHPKSIFDDMIFSLPIPENFRLFRDKTNENFLSFLSRLGNHPDKYISVYFEELEEEDFDKNWVKETRQKLSWKYYDEDFFEDEKVKIEKYRLGNQPDGYKLWGLWQNKKYIVGGTFQSFAFYDKKHKSAILIDNSVYFPPGYKLKALVELEEISKNIKIKEKK